MTTTDHLHFSALPLHRQRRRKTGEMDEDYLDSVEPSSPLATSSAPSRGPPAVDGSSNHTNAPTPFLKGIGLSVWQNSSDEHSQWTHFIKKNHYYGDRSAVTARAMEKSNDFWHLYEQHIVLAKTMGITSFRFSFEWARLEPTGPGQWDPAAFRRFHDIIDCIRKHGLEPFATLHHFTHPQWFEELHSFEREENIAFFLRYARHVFAEFSGKVKFWATFNEPTCFSFVGYIVGLWSPGHHGRMEMCGRVLAHLLKAHTAAYRQLKSMPGGREAQIGIVHQHISFFPKQEFWPHVRLLCKWMTYWFAAEVILKFFSTGIFEWKAPFRGVVVRFVDADAPDTLDWWGINYYSRPCINAFFGMGASNANEPVGDSHFRCFPEGLMMSIREASVLRVPIYITETGVADKDSRYRQYFIETHYSVILKALAEGYDIRGVFFWTLMDNIEWHELFHIKFGLFAWDPAKCGCPGELPLRPGGETLRRLYEEWPDTVDQLRALALQQQGDSLMSRKAASASTESLLPKHPPNPLAMQLMGNPLYDVRLLRQDSAAIPLTGGNAASRRS